MEESSPIKKFKTGENSIICPHIWRMDTEMFESQYFLRFYLFFQYRAATRSWQAFGTPAHPKGKQEKMRSFQVKLAYKAKK